MKIISNTVDFRIHEKTAVAIGKFDGVHLGHRKLLEIIKKAKEKGLKAAVFTFAPSPGTYFSGKVVPELTTREEKQALFEKLGVDYLVEYPFNRETSRIAPEDFVNIILLKQMSAKMIVAGEDVSFGYRGTGNEALLEKISREKGFEVKIVPKICYENTIISSTYIRNVLQKGNMELVHALMGEPYFLSGVVSTGNQLGRTMGMPTVNLLPREDKLLPPKGVYFSTVDYEGTVYKGITNIGQKPTFGTENPIGVETYIYDFSKMIYGEVIQIRLYHFKRPEQKFADVNELKQAIAENIAQGAEYFRENW